MKTTTSFFFGVLALVRAGLKGPNTLAQ